MTFLLTGPPVTSPLRLRSATMTTAAPVAPGGTAALWPAAGLAMTAFAANSVLARLALVGSAEGAASTDPGTFTLLRLASGAAVLTLLVAGRGRSRPALAGSWASAVLLLTYAGCFSYAYVTLGAATGALILFGVVQTGMLVAAVRAGERPSTGGRLGLAAALVGLVVLVGPGARAPGLAGALAMAVAGAAWAGYTLRGRGAGQPLLVTAGNFLRSVPLAAGLAGAAVVGTGWQPRVSAGGVGYAVLSGAVASGLGYALWYSVVPRLTRLQSGIVQLTPAPLATVGGLLLLSEPVTWRVAGGSLLILGGVLLGVVAPRSEGVRGS